VRPWPEDLARGEPGLEKVEAQAWRGPHAHVHVHAEHVRWPVTACVFACVCVLLLLPSAALCCPLLRSATRYVAAMMEGGSSGEEEELTDALGVLELDEIESKSLEKVREPSIANARATPPLSSHVLCSLLRAAFTPPFWLLCSDVLCVRSCARAADEGEARGQGNDGSRQRRTAVPHRTAGA
jgi:hypothetical protein